MATSITESQQYKDLLTPLKDAEKVFSIDITELLVNYLAELMDKKTVPNFNSAALVLQGSTSVYAKKVELLYNQVIQLHNNLQKEQRNDKEPQEKKETHKDRARREDKLDDPFYEPEIKIGKNLSCLTKKNSTSASKKTAKKANSFGAPVHLLMNDNDDKGEPFYDTRGDLIGNKGDFVINQCVTTASGWLVLPTVNPNLVPPQEAVSDCHDDFDSVAIEPQESDLEPIQSTPDEGFGSCPSSGLQQCAPEVDSEVANPDQATPMSTDEGIGETPGDAPDFADSPGAENTPINDGEEGPSTAVPQPVRQRNRQASGRSKLSIEECPLLGIHVSKELCKKKAIAKNNVRRLPEKLRNDGAESETSDETISAYCNRIFFSVNDKILRGSLLNFEVETFSQNSSFMRRVTDKLKVLRSSDKRNKCIAPIEDSYLLDTEVEVSRDANEDDKSLYVPFNEEDIHVEHDPAAMIEHPRMNLPAADDVNLPERDSPDASQGCCAMNVDVDVDVENTDTTEAYQEWEKDVKSFLEKMEQRGSFDIVASGSRILNSFEDSNHTQTRTFREICRNMEKWEIHRSFMALLPLANMGNVQLDKEKNEDGSEDIAITLLSRKMHHKDLEEFNHKDGEQSDSE